jgi:hypothetical protein
LLSNTNNTECSIQAVLQSLGKRLRISPSSCCFAAAAAAAEECYRTVLALLWADMFGLEAGIRERREIQDMKRLRALSRPRLLTEAGHSLWILQEAPDSVVGNTMCHTSKLRATRIHTSLNSSIRRYALWMSRKRVGEVPVAWVISLYCHEVRHKHRQRRYQCRDSSQVFG